MSSNYINLPVPVKVQSEQYEDLPFPSSGSKYDPATDPISQAVWESDSNVSLSSGLITSWTDRTSNAFIATGAVTHQPSIAANELNGLPTIKMNKANPDGLYLATGTALIPAVGNPFNITVILKTSGPSLNTFETIFTSHLTVANETFFFLTSNNADYTIGTIWASSTQYTSGSTNGFASPITFDGTSYHSFSMSYDGNGTAGSLQNSNFSFNEDTTNIPVINSSSFGSDSGTIVPTIGAQNNTSYTFPADYYIAGIYIFNSKTVPAQFPAYINSKWGISI